MSRRAPGSTRTDTLFPYTTLFRSGSCNARAATRPISFPAPSPIAMAKRPALCPDVWCVARRHKNTNGEDKMIKKPISADSHITEPPHCYVDYTDTQYRDRATRTKRPTRELGTQSWRERGVQYQ